MRSRARSRAARLLVVFAAGTVTAACASTDPQAAPPVDVPGAEPVPATFTAEQAQRGQRVFRSEERRVGKECRSRRAPYREKERRRTLTCVHGMNSVSQIM